MDQIKKIQNNKWTKKYSIDEVFFNGQLKTQTTDYLKNQDYLDYKKIKQVLKINFNKVYPIGYVLKVENKIVGFVGTLFSERKINKKDYIYCNIHTWIVNESHRLSSHLLFFPLIKKKCIITVLTPLKRLCSLFQKIGFSVRTMKYRVIFSINFFNFFQENSLQIEKKTIEIKKKLNKHDWKIYQDHSDLSFIKFIVFNKNEKSNFSFIISRKVKKNKFFYVLNILYVSNKSFFKKNWQSINEKISTEFKVFFCAQYFLNETECVLPNNTKFSINRTKDICVKNLPANMKFDTLYSEMIY